MFVRVCFHVFYYYLRVCSLGGCYNRCCKTCSARLDLYIFWPCFSAGHPLPMASIPSLFLLREAEEDPLPEAGEVGDSKGFQGPPQQKSHSCALHPAADQLPSLRLPQLQRQLWYQLGRRNTSPPHEIGHRSTVQKLFETRSYPHGQTESAL